MSRETSPIDQIADQWVGKMAELSPSFATYIGRSGNEDKLDDPSPESEAIFLKETKNVLAQLANVAPQDKVDEVTLDAMRRSLELDVEIHDSGLWKRNLDVIASPAQGIREIFDLSPTATEGDWANIAKRLASVPDAVEGYIRTLREGIAAGDTPARRQVEWVLREVQELAGKESFFVKFAGGAKAGDSELSGGLKADVEKAGARAAEGYGALAEFLANELLPNANKVDAIGRERYALLSRKFLGAKVDLDETYEWGIEELARVTAEQNAVANQIKPGATVQEAIEVLNNDASRKLHGTKALQEWMQKLSDTAIEKLGGTHFDIAEPIRKLECMIAPSNSGAIYYTGPTDDFSRPGRMWWSVPAGVDEFDTWRETTTVYHEGVPGHHLQVAQAVYNRAELNSWRRLASWTSGHGEGWALYAERLMADLGFLDDPGDRLGMLDGQRMRAARVVLDLGVHLGKDRLDGNGKWDFEYALEFMGNNVNMSKEFVNFEVHRYFGWPAQAPSYKIGQRIWEQIRDEYATRKGGSFDIKEFHREALNLGGLGLDTLRVALLG
ncbi:MAG: DUF885 domain-containing protein [Actinomycetales bacterium]|nr:DUF885 domain-containing protein [Actinomycetales bacterium]